MAEFHDVDLSVNVGTYNRPKKFKGTPEERHANFHTHVWTSFRYGDGLDDVESFCDVCCCKPWGELAHWPCGRAEREIVKYSSTTGRYVCDDDG